jgi:hypothetical protein
LVNRQYLLFTETWRHSKFGCNFVQNLLRKHHAAFVKVVEGSEIYNFPIYHFVHFYSKILRKNPVKRCQSDTLSRAARARDATRAPRRRRTRTRAVPPKASAPRTSRGRAPSPAPRVPRRHEVLPPLVPRVGSSAAPGPVGRTVSDRWSPLCPSLRAVPRPRNRCPSARLARVAYKGVAAPRLTCRAADRYLCSPPPPSMAAAAEPRPR